MSQEVIYLDYNATHPPFQKIIERAQQKYYLNYANSSGLSSFSQNSRFLIEESRRTCAEVFCVSVEQIIFTSSATEANFLAIHLICEYLKALKNKTRAPVPNASEVSGKAANEEINIAVSPLEHPSISETLKRLPYARVNILPLDNRGLIDLTFLKRLLEDQKVDFVICTLVHNETGIIQPLEGILELIKNFSVPFLCDAVQALSRLSTGSSSEGLRPHLFSASNELPVFFTIEGHKIGAGFGTGSLIIPLNPGYKQLSHFVPFSGGSQEFELRAGSHNIPSILAFAEVLREKYLCPLVGEQSDQGELTRHFEQKLEESLKFIGAKIVGSESPRLAGTTMVVLPGVPIDFFLMGLDEANIVVSTGTSCKSRSRTPSPGLLALGLSEKEALSVIRFSYDENFSLEKQSFVLKMVQKIIRHLIDNNIKETIEIKKDESLTDTFIYQ